MGLGSFLHTFWGLFMGTSVNYMKSDRSHYFPDHFEDGPAGFVFHVGGGGNGMFFYDDQDLVLINTNCVEAAKTLYERVEPLIKTRSVHLIFTTDREAVLGGEPLFRNPKRVLRPLKRPWSEELNLAGHRLIVEEILSGTLSIRFPGTGVLFAGDLFYHKVFPEIPRKGRSFVKEWVQSIRALEAKENPRVVVPGEGPLGSLEDLVRFRKFLEDLLNESKSFSEVHQTVSDFQEIIGLTSFSETFDHARS